jgi:hypothetical protein
MDKGCDEKESSAGRIGFTEIVKGVEVVKFGDRSLDWMNMHHLCSSLRLDYRQASKNISLQDSRT